MCIWPNFNTFKQVCCFNMAFLSSTFMLQHSDYVKLVLLQELWTHAKRVLIDITLTIKYITYITIFVASLP